ncbi:MAG: hypothetical protein AB8B58_20185, partial [Roseobacter sp.]
GGRSVDYLKFSLENVIFTSYEFDAGEPDDPDPRLTEAVVMDFSKMTIAYTEFGGAGAGDAVHSAVIQN